MNNKNNEKLKLLAYKYKFDENGKFVDMETNEIEAESIELSLVQQVRVVKGSKEYYEAIKKGLIKE